MTACGITNTQLPPQNRLRSNRHWTSVQNHVVQVVAKINYLNNILLRSDRSSFCPQQFLSGFGAGASKALRLARFKAAKMTSVALPQQDALCSLARVIVDHASQRFSCFHSLRPTVSNAAFGSRIVYLSRAYPLGSSFGLESVELVVVDA